MQCFLVNLVQHLSRIASNHRPLLITIDAMVLPRPSFHFKKLCTFYSRYWKLIRVVWRMSICGDVRYRMTRRLELARCRLFWWNRTEVGNIFKHIEKGEVDIVDL